MMLSLLLTAAALAVVPDRPRGEIQERLDGQPNFTFQTAKKPIDLEFCVADVVSKMASPSAFRDGPNRSIVIASARKVTAAIELDGSQSGTTVIGHIFAKGWDDRMRDRIQACL